LEVLLVLCLDLFDALRVLVLLVAFALHALDLAFEVLQLLLAAQLEVLLVLLEGVECGQEGAQLLEDRCVLGRLQVVELGSLAHDAVVVLERLAHGLLVLVELLKQLVVCLLDLVEALLLDRNLFLK